MTSVQAVLFPGITPLDLVGTVEVLRRAPGLRITYAAEDLAKISLGDGLSIQPDAVFTSAEETDVVFVPGGPGVSAAMRNTFLLDFLRRQADSAEWVSAVCTGSLVLAAAGLLDSRRSTTHWYAHDHLAALGATGVQERVVVDGKFVTAAGVSSGIELGFTLVELLRGPDAAKKIRLEIEYDPVAGGSLESLKAERPDLVAEVLEATKTMRSERGRTIEGQLPGS